MKPSAKEHSCGLREDEALGAGDTVSGAFLSHADRIQQGSLFVKKKMR